MRSRTILTVFGTRPEAVKMAPVIRALEADPKSFRSLVCCTGQHEQLVQQAMGSFGLHADITLKTMEPGQSLGLLTSRLFSQLDGAIADVRPDYVLVQGDTTSAMAAAMCSFYRKIPVGHVEAGLRSHDRFAPFPEEVNREIVGRATTLHFAPTPRAAENLRHEGVAEAAIHVTGNTVVDALEWIKPRIDAQASAEVKRLAALHAGRRLVLVTSHRRESFGEGIEGICRAIARIVERHKDVAVVFVTHLNPNVREPVMRLLGKEPRIALIDPVDYFSLLFLIASAYLILTDSGGIQEEAPSFAKPVLVMRKVTERTEAADAGFARIVGTDTGVIVAVASELLESSDAYARMAPDRNPFGDGCAARRIARILRDHG